VCNLASIALPRFVRERSQQVCLMTLLGPCVLLLLSALHAQGGSCHVSQSLD
jgi:hypothetical protein